MSKGSEREDNLWAKERPREIQRQREREAIKTETLAREQHKWMKSKEVVQRNQQDNRRTFIFTQTLKGIFYKHCFIWSTRETWLFSAFYRQDHRDSEKLEITPRHTDEPQLERTIVHSGARPWRRQRVLFKFKKKEGIQRGTKLKIYSKFLY